MIESLKLTRFNPATSESFRLGDCYRRRRRRSFSANILKWFITNIYFQFRSNTSIQYIDLSTSSTLQIHQIHQIHITTPPLHHLQKPQQLSKPMLTWSRSSLTEAVSAINQKKSIKLDSSINQILTKSVVNKSTKVDIEEVLQQHLLPKFGERFKQYRKLALISLKLCKLIWIVYNELH